LMQSVPDHMRGRVFGLFITVSGLTGNLSHWIVGGWVKNLGAEAGSPTAYYPFYLVLAALIVLSLLGLPCLHGIQKRELSTAITSSAEPTTAVNPQFE